MTDPPREPLAEKGHCPKCGYRLAELYRADRAPQERLSCPECGHVMQQGVVFAWKWPTERGLAPRFADQPVALKLLFAMMAVPLLAILAGLLGWIVFVF